MILWRFKVFVSSSGRNEIQGEVNRLGDYGLAQFERSVTWAAFKPKAQWGRPSVAKLQGFKLLYEIRFNSGNVEVRPLGCFGPGADEFTIVLWSTKKGSNYNPRDALNTAERRAKSVVGGKAEVVSLQIDGEDFPANDEE
jgi:hypothetical protein